MEYRCRRIESNLTIDGDLGKPEWKAAEAVALKHNATGGSIKLNTSVKLLWNNDFLYVGFNCQDDYVCATMTEYNDKLYEEDVVEIFIDDDRDLKTYVEVEVNPLNAVLHYNIQNNLNKGILQFARVQKVVHSAVVRDEGNKAFTVELTIPLTEFITAKNNPPIKGDRWLMNLYRIDRAKDGTDEHSAWSPTDSNYHVPQRFGELIFE